MIQTNSNGISFETVYFLDIECFDAQTLGVMDAFVTQAKTVVRFVMIDGSTNTEKPTTGSYESFSTSVFKISSSVRSFANSSSLPSSHKTEINTPVETTKETTASSTHSDAASVSTTTTIPVTFSSSGITTPIKGK